MAGRWLIVCCLLSGCRADSRSETSEFRATLDAREFLGTYDVRVDLPLGFSGKVKDGTTAWIEGHGEPTVIVGVDLFAEENVVRRPCDMRFPLREAAHTLRSRTDLEDGHVAICDDTDEGGALVVRYVRAGRGGLYCLAKLDTRAANATSRMVSLCRSMTVHGPHIADLSPAVWDEVTLTDVDSASQVHVKLEVPIGYVKRHDGQTASWEVPQSPRRWPSITVTVLSAGELSAVPAGFLIKSEDGMTSATRFIRLGPVVLMCAVRIKGAPESQVGQMKEVCTSAVAELEK